MSDEDNGQFDFPRGDSSAAAVMPPPSIDMSLPVPPPASGPAVPKRTVWLDLPAEYGQAGMKLKVWTNYPSKLAKAIGESEEAADLGRKLQRLRQRAERVTDPSEGERLDEQIGRLEDELAEVSKRDQAQRIAAYNRVLIEHNGWVQGEDDPEPGRPYPPANTPEFIDACSNELFAVIMNLLGRAIAELPQSTGRLSRYGRR